MSARPTVESREQHLLQACRPWGSPGVAPPDFDRSVNPISTKGGSLCPPNDAGTLGFSDLPTTQMIIVGIPKI